MQRRSRRRRARLNRPVTKHTSAENPVSYRTIVAIAVPIMISNVTTPLIGVVDTAIVGQIPSPTPIGAVALGSLLFTFLFWAFGFLRMATTGLTAQALGAGDPTEVRLALARALATALVAGGVLLLLQAPLRGVAFGILSGTAAVEGLAQTYFDTRIWSAPAALTNYALLGWFVGLGRAKAALALQLILNLSNMGLDAYFVLQLEMGVIGVALGTVLAECLAAAAGVALAVYELRRIGGDWELGQLFDRPALRRMLAVSRDIMIRSLALLAVFLWFTDRGAAQGDVVLAANAILMHLVTVSSFFLDGIAYATESLVGQAYGARDRRRLRDSVRKTTHGAAFIALLLVAVFAAGGPSFVALVATDPATQSQASRFLPWAVLAPLAGVWCFQLDGVFIGATRTQEMRNAMLTSFAIFLLAWWFLRPLGNHGLWGALFVHYAARTATLWRHYGDLARPEP